MEKHMLHENLYNKEAELANTTKRRLTDGTDIDSLQKLRLMCLSRGATGFFDLARTFRRMNAGNNVLGVNELRKGLKDIGIHIYEDEIQDIFQTLDKNGRGEIELTELIYHIRPPMSKGRLEIIDKAFNKMDLDGDGVITTKDLRRVYNVRTHPHYLNGDRTEDEILSEFLAMFEYHGRTDGVLTKEEFLNYYSAVSASIDQDGYFDLFMRKAYKL